jgi:DNA-binding NtrC family response regulator
VNGGAAALRAMEAAPFDAVVTDLRMAPPDGLALLEQARRRWPSLTIVLMTAYASMETARRALTMGAYDYVDKSGAFRDELCAILAKAERERALTDENHELRRQAAHVVGDSPALRQALDLASRVAVTDSTVLLRGESGTGKDVFARTVHLASRRRGRPFIKVNCGAMPEALLESELFGHEKGAFTGAIRQKPGRFEDADGGTIFLDEIGELSLALQVKLLQVIEEKTFHRVGGNAPVRVDVRILAATNRDLEAMVRERAFREDLFFRLDVFPIVLPPLRERPGDVARLTAWFLERHGVPADHLTPAAAQALERHPFPGNVRELENTLERALILAGADPIAPEHLPFARTAAPAAAGTVPPWVPLIPPEGLSLETLERELIVQALERAGGNKSQAARLLGLTRRTLYSRMERHGLRRPGEGDDAGDAGEEPGAGGDA